MESSHFRKVLQTIMLNALWYCCLTLNIMKESESFLHSFLDIPDLFESKYIVTKENLISNIRKDICQGNVDLIQGTCKLVEEDNVFQHIVSPDHQYHDSNCKRTTCLWMSNMILHQKHIMQSNSRNPNQKKVKLGKFLSFGSKRVSPTSIRALRSFRR